MVPFLLSALSSLTYHCPWASSLNIGEHGDLLSVIGKRVHLLWPPHETAFDLCRECRVDDARDSSPPWPPGCAVILYRSAASPQLLRRTAARFDSLRGARLSGSARFSLSSTYHRGCSLFPSTSAHGFRR